MTQQEEVLLASNKDGDKEVTIWVKSNGAHTVRVNGAIASFAMQQSDAFLEFGAQIQFALVRAGKMELKSP